MDSILVSKRLPSTSPILHFYKGKSVLVTGGTGFLGMVLIEKILFACEDVKYIYVLIKEKRGKTAQERLTSVLSLEAFQRIKDQNPDKLNKVVPIAGNLVEKNFGLSDADLRTIQKEVSVVFHMAASIKLDSPLDEAIKINTRAAEKIIQLCKSIRQLSVLVYTSTAYSNCNRKVIEEKVYQNKYPLKSVYYVVDKIKNNTLVSYLIDGRPNTYSYSKALAEEIFANEIKEIPVAIVRPSISVRNSEKKLSADPHNFFTSFAVTSALREPVPHWVHGVGGNHIIVTAMGKGSIRCWHGDPEAVCDIVPVDTVVNLTIAAAWDVFRRRNAGKNEIKVFNCCSGLQNPLSTGKLLLSAVAHAKKHFIRETIIPPMLVFIQSRLLWLILAFFIQTIPAYFFAGIELLLMRKRSIIKLHEKMSQLTDVLKFFTINQFLLIDYNVRQLCDEMDELDREMFDFDVKNINWDDYIESYVLGLKKYILKET